MLSVFVIQKNGDKTYWNRCGVAFANQDGSYNLKLDLFPDVQLQMREAKSNDEKETGNARNNSHRR